MEVTATELSNSAGKFLKLVEENDEIIEITRHGQVVARLSRPMNLPIARPVPWKRSASAGTAGSPKAADGRSHRANFPCPAGKPYRLSPDGRMWLEDWPPLNLKIVDRVLGTAFPQRARR